MLLQRTRTAPVAPGPGFTLLVDVLAGYRLTRLATADVISEPVRQRIVRGAGAFPLPGAEHQSAQQIVESLDDALAVSAGAVLLARLEHE